MINRVYPSVFTFLVTLTLLSTMVFPQGSVQPDTEFVWPIAGNQGKVCLGFGPVVNPKTNLQIFNDGYIFCVDSGTPVVAMGSGVIMAVYEAQCLYPDFARSVTFKTAPDTGAKPSAADSAASDSALRARGISPSWLTSAVSMKLGRGLVAHYQGLQSNIPVRVGQHVKKGDTIGYSGYMRIVFDDPAVMVSVSLNTRVHDMGRYLFGKDYKPKDTALGKGTEYDPVRKFAPEELREDFALVRSSLEEAHPGLYTYTKKEEFDRVFDSAFRELDKPKTEDEFTMILLSVLSRVGCGHTNLIRSQSWYTYNKMYLPIDVCFVGDQCYVVRDYSELNPLSPGTEILSVNGRPFTELRNRLREMITSDGFNTTLKDYWVARQVKSLSYGAFGSVRQNSLLIRSQDGKERMVTVPGMPMMTMGKKKAAAKTIDQSIRDAVELKWLDSGAAFLRVNDFETFDRDQIADLFKQLAAKKTTSLIIDLRGNPGGEVENLKLLYSFLANDAFYLPMYKRVNVRGEYQLFKHTDNYMPGMTMFDDFVEMPGKAGFYQYEEKVQPQSVNHFDGQVIILIDGATFSAASEFCAVARRQKRAVFVGEETGGGYYQLTAEKFGFMRLGHVPIQIRIPLVTSIDSEESDPAIPFGHGIIPDHVIVKPLGDYLDPTHDSVLEYAKGLVGKM